MIADIMLIIAIIGLLITVTLETCSKRKHKNEATACNRTLSDETVFWLLMSGAFLMQIIG